MKITSRNVAWRIAVVMLLAVAVALIGCGIGGGSGGTKVCLQCSGSGQALLDCQLQQPPGCPN